MKMSESSINKVTTILNGHARILKAFCIGPVENPAENDYYNFDINNIFITENVLIKEGNNLTLISGKEYPVFFIDRTDKYNAGIDFSDYVTGDNGRFFIFANIFCDNTKETILRFGKNCRMKVWLNGTLIFNGYSYLGEPFFVLSTLNEGNNLIFIEYLTRNAQSGTVFSLLISEYCRDTSNTVNAFTESFLEQRVKSKFRIINKSCCICENTHKLYIIPADFNGIDMSKPPKITIYNSYGVKIDCFEASFYEFVTLNTHDYRKNISETCFIRLEISCFNKDGEEKIQNFKLAFQDSLPHFEEKATFYESIINKLPFSPDISGNGINKKTILRDILSDYKKSIIQFKSIIDTYYYKPHAGIIDQITFLYRKLRDILSSDSLCVEHCICLSDTEKCFAEYYRSKLDESIQKYVVSIPESYTMDKKYPVIVDLIPNVEIYLYTNINHFDALEDVIFAYVSTRNVTLGSYIGEASIMECIEEIKKTYSIDEDRIYIHGYSNGAYACWGLIQSYPHVFAAAAPISGCFYAKNIKNIFSTPFFSFLGDKDELHIIEANDEIKKQTEFKDNHGEFEILTFPESDHWTVNSIPKINKTLIEWLLKHERKLYRNKSYFRTERVCHSGNEWIQIISIEKKAKYCEFELEVRDNSHINIDIVNVKEFVLKLPNYISTTNLKISINSQDLFISGHFDKNELFFSKNDQGYNHMATGCYVKYISSSWGMGLLNIFMDSLKIVVPSSFSSKEECDVINKIAQNFSEPKSNGYDPNITVKYPILDDNTPENVASNSNLILISLGGNNKLIEKIKNHLYFKMDENGFSYNGLNFEKNYCLMFIQPSPLNPRQKILVIYSNSINLIKNHLFLRKVVVPSYYNDLHPYLNQEAIIFDGKNYSVIDVLGNDIAKHISM